MKAEEIDALLAALPPRTASDVPPAPEVPAERESPYKAAYEAMAPNPPLPPLPSPEEIEAVRASTRQRRREEWLAGLRAKRVALRGRLKSRILQALEKTPTPCVVLLGPTGIGKTSAMLWLEAEWPGYHIHARELASSERRHGLGEGYPPEMLEARQARVLYLDDIGAEEPRDLTALQFLLDYRYSKGLATVATSGLTATELAAHLGAAYYRRLVDQHVARKDATWPVLLIDCHAKAKP